MVSPERGEFIGQCTPKAARMRRASERFPGPWLGQSVSMREWVRVSFMFTYTSNEQAMQPVTYQ